MKLGLGKIDITPSPGVELAGYGYYLERKNTGVMDPLYVRCVSVREGNRACLLINADLMQMDARLCGAVREGLSGEYDMVTMTCIHSHTAPLAGEAEACGVQDEAYVSSLPGRFLHAARLARADETEVTSLRVSDKEIPPVGFNRADRDGPNDRHVRGLLVRRENAKSVALLSYPCHPVTLGRLSVVSADYPGEAVRAMERRGMEAVFFTGCCGDVDPVNNLVAWGTGTREIIAGYGEQLALGLMAGLDEKETERSLAFAEAPMTLFRRHMTREEIREMAIGQSGGTEHMKRLAETWERRVLSDMAKGRDLERTPFTTRAVALGDFVLVAIPFEAFTRTAGMIREAFPGKTVCALGCADQTLCYLPTEDEFDKGSYAALSSVMIYLGLPLRRGEAERIGREAGAALSRKIENA